MRGNRTTIPLTLSRGRIRLERASVDVRHLNVTSPVVLYSAYSNVAMCDIKVRDNNIRECTPFAKFAKIIDREYFATYGTLTHKLQYITVQPMHLLVQ